MPRYDFSNNPMIIKAKRPDEIVEPVPPVEPEMPEKSEQDLVRDYLLSKFSESQEGNTNIAADLAKAADKIGTTAGGILTGSIPDSSKYLKSSSSNLSDRELIKNYLGLSNLEQRERQGNRRLGQGEQNVDLRKKGVDLAEKKFKRQVTRDDVGDTKDLQNEVASDKQNERALKALDAANNVKSLVASHRAGNRMAMQALRTQLPRLMGEVGNLNESEQKIWGGSRAIVDRLAQISAEFSSGQYTPENLNYIEGIVTSFEKSAGQKMDEAYKRKAKEGAARLNKSPEEIYEKIRPNMELNLEGKVTSVPSKSEQLLDMSKAQKQAEKVMADPKASPEKKAKAQRVLEIIRKQLNER